MDIKEFIEKAKSFEFNTEFLQGNKINRELFCENFRFEELLNLPIKRYTLTKSFYENEFRDTFYYWLEFKKGVGGSIGSVKPHQYYIYMNKENGQYYKGTKSNSKCLVGDELQEEYSKLLRRIVLTILLAKEDKIKEITQLDLCVYDEVMLKILSLYEPDKFMAVYSNKVLKDLSKILNLPDSNNRIEMNYLLTKKIKTIEPFNEWSIYKVNQFVWNMLGKDKEH